MPLGIIFKPKHIENDIWLAGVEEHDDEEDHNKDKTNNTNQNENDDQEMDTNNIHEIMHDPYKFHIPNQNHQPSIQEEQYHQPNITNDITNNYNETDKYIMNALFDNIEKEIIFNDDDIDEDELDEDNGNENNIVTNQHDNTYPDEDNQNNQEPNEDYQNIANKRTKNPNTKYKYYYQCLMNQQKNKNPNMEIKEYDSKEAKIMLMFIQYQISKTQNTKYKNYKSV